MTLEEQVFLKAGDQLWAYERPLRWGFDPTLLEAFVAKFRLINTIELVGALVQPFAYYSYLCAIRKNRGIL